MTDHLDDGRLRGRFGELRGETIESGRVPDFESMLATARADASSGPTLGVIEGGAPRVGSAPRAYRRYLRAGAWASAALAATVAGLMLTDRRPRNDDEFLRIVAAYTDNVSGGAWRSPTSQLLEVPGMELGRSVPQVGGPVRGLDPATLPPPEPVPPEENL